jgi:uncharacterized protein YeeX (DUF496 family)
VTNIRGLADQIVDYIVSWVAPPMSQEDALAVLESIQDDLEARIDALRDETD